METKWTILEKRSKFTPFDIPIDNNILNILTNRGINTKKAIKNFINPKLENLEEATKLINLSKAVEYILDSIKENKSICIYGDYDVDGITSTSLLYLILKRIGCTNLSYYIPLRNEGYGLNKLAIKELKDSGVDLIITVDCGINSYEEVDYINSLGMQAIITDHHDISTNRLPKALACINPKREDNDYSFKELAGVGVVFMLISELLKSKDMVEYLYDYLDLVTLGTIADIMPLIGENRIIVKYGLEKLRYTKNLGLKTLLNKLNLSNKELTSGDVSFKIAPIFNATGRLSDARLGVQLLISENQAEINSLLNTLISNNIDRKKMQEDIIQNVLEEIETKQLYNNYILISHSPDYHHGIIGIVAAKVLETYYKPSIIIEENPETGLAVGSCRSIEDFNITKALSYVSKLLVKFGGHKGAAGFTIKLENLEEFKIELEKYAKSQLENIKLKKNIKVDMKIPAQKISYEFIQSLNLLKPFGFGNPTPLLMTENCIVHNATTVGESKNHLKFDIDQKSFSIKNAFWFNNGNRLNEFKNSSIFYDIVFKLEVNEYNGRYYPNMLVEDMKQSNLKDDRFFFYYSMYQTSFPIKSVFYTTLDISKEDKIHIKKKFSNYSILIGQKTISKLNDNVSNLLSYLNEFYGFDFKVKIEKIEEKEEFKAIHIIIKREYMLENYSNLDKVQFNNIKRFLLGNLEYNSFTKEALSALYKQDKSLLINSNNINVYLEDEKIDIKESYYYNFLLTVAMKYYFEYNKKINFYTKNKYFIEYTPLKNYINFLDKIDEKEENDIAIYDFNSIKIPSFKIKNKKIIVFCNKDYTNTKLYDIKKEEHLPRNIFRLKKKLLENIDYESIFLEYIPIENKVKILEDMKKGKVIYSDESIINYI